ncbi:MULTISPECIES: hypothetical protein [Streptomyces]|uniref:hypothetical protein n=1 Tax=Streptomyces TaxID=1883 RepID=UPI001FD57716|nr:hypothetical protein [Streptomyces kasugaensis]
MVPGIASPRPRHRLRLAFALVVLAPLVGEFLLGNQPVTALPVVLMLAPMYGCGALLIREAARRAGGGWPTMLLLAAAYALLEEGPIDQMLWNPHYGGVDMGLAYAGTQVPWLGTSAAMVQDVLSMHMVWSICVPIALIETFSADRTRPWLGGPGLAVTGVVFVAGSIFLAQAQYQSGKFMGSTAQFAGVSAAIVALLAAAFAAVRRPLPPRDAATPAPWIVGTAAFAAGSLYWAHDTFLPDNASPWAPLALWFVLAGGIAWLCARWSRTHGWGPDHRLALTAGALLTYVWLGFTHAREMDVPYGTALLGNVLFGAAALVLLGVAAMRLRRRVPPAEGG